MDYIAIVNIKQYIHDMYLCVYLYFFIIYVFLYIIGRTRPDSGLARPESGLRKMYGHSTDVFYLS